MGEQSGITVFTPVYNRTYCIGKAYRSLLEQTYQNFEWIIIDDGSTDNLHELVNEWIQEGKIKIIYIRVDNGGKMRAHNVAVMHANKPAFFTLDSDDNLPPNSLKLVWEWFEHIKLDARYAGVAGLRNCSTVQVEEGWEYKDITNCQRRENGLSMDAAECYKTDILKKYLAPEYENENYLSPTIVTNAMGRDGYLVRWYNKKIYNFEFQQDGLTRSGDEKFYRNYKGWANLICLNCQCKQDENYREFAYYRYAKLQQGDLSICEIAQLLKTDEKTIFAILKKKPFIINRLNSFFMENGIHTVAIYGLGQEATRFIRFIDDYSFKIVCGIDRKPNSLLTPCYSLKDNWGEVDAIIITNKYFIKEIREDLTRIKNVKVYSLQEDILPRPWNYYFCDL